MQIGARYSIPPATWDRYYGRWCFFTDTSAKATDTFIVVDIFLSAVRLRNIRNGLMFNTSFIDRLALIPPSLYRRRA